MVEEIMNEMETGTVVSLQETEKGYALYVHGTDGHTTVAVLSPSEITQLYFKLGTAIMEMDMGTENYVLDNDSCIDVPF